MSFDPVEFGAGIGKAVREEIDIAVKPIKEVKQRLGVLESERTFIHAMIHNAIQPLRDKIQKLEAERGSTMTYLGVWDSEHQYEK